MLLIVTPNHKSQDEVQRLARTAEVLGWNVYKNGWRIPKHLHHTPGAVYGEQFFCEAIAEQMGWRLLSNSLDWLTKLPEEYVSRKIELKTFEEARKIEEEKFIKPADDKCFPAKVYSSGKDLPLLPIINNVPSLISDVMKFTSEYRCFIKNKIVTTVCCYSYKHTYKEVEINNPENYNINNDAVIEFVSNLLRDERVECAPGSVIDVGRFKKDTYAVIESNPIYASGTYGCEMVAVLDAIKEACVNE